MEPWIAGIDVSNHQGAIDWNAINSNPVIGFVWGLVSDGTFRGTPKGGSVSVSSAYNNNKKNCRKPFGPYHFARPRTTDPYNIAEAVVNWCGGPCELPHVLDLEDEATGDMPLVDQVGWCRAWLTRVEELEQRRPVIYTKTGGIIRFFPDHKWWLPFYPANSKINPDPEQYRAWMDGRLKGNDGRYYDIWQYSSSGRLDGIAGNVDLNLMSPSTFKEIVKTEEDQPVATSCIAHANIEEEDRPDNMTGGLRSRGFTPFPDVAFQCFDNGTMRQINGDEVNRLKGLKFTDIGFRDDTWFSLFTVIPRDRLA